MRFLLKSPDSPLLAEGLAYAVGGHNEELQERLLAEQQGFCAYTEKRVDALDTLAVEHFDPRLKGKDDARNYYAVLQTANQRKRRKERQYAGAGFFDSRFFQDAAHQGRVAYLAGEGVFAEASPGDDEARDLIDYLGFNDPELYEARRAHVARLRDLFRLAGWHAEEQRAWFRRFPHECSFPSALEGELGLPDLLGHET